MADHFTTDEWQLINARLDGDSERYGFPQLRDGSVLLGSFNIRKLGDPDNRSGGGVIVTVRQTPETRIWLDAHGNAQRRVL